MLGVLCRLGALRPLASAAPLAQFMRTPQLNRRLCQSAMLRCSKEVTAGVSEEASSLPFRKKPHPVSKRFAFSRKPFFPIYANNLRPYNKAIRKKTMGRGMGGRGGLFGRNFRKVHSAGKTSRTSERADMPMFKKIPRWPEAHYGRNKRSKLDPLNLAKLRYFLEKGRLDARFPITQRHLFDSGCIRKIKTGVKLYNINDFPFPYKIDIEVAGTDQSSVDAIRAVGGTVTVVYMEKVALRSHIKPWKYEVLPRTARPTTKMVTLLEKQKARGALVRYIKPLWLIEEEKRLQTQIRELRGEDGNLVAKRLSTSTERM